MLVTEKRTKIASAEGDQVKYTVKGCEVQLIAGDFKAITNVYNEIPTHAGEYRYSE